MPAYPKIVQIDSRGQLVIPKNVRKELDISEGAAFWVYETEDGIFLKKVEAPKMDEKRLKRL